MKMRTGVVWVVVVLLITVRTGQAMDANDVRAGYLARLRLLRNVVVVYDVKDVATGDPAARIMSELKKYGVDVNESSFSVVDGSARVERFSCLDGMARYESGAQLMMATPSHDGGVEHETTDVQSQVTIVAGGGVEHLLILPWAPPQGRITSGPHYDNGAIDEPWGLRYLGELMDDRLPEECKVKVLGDGKGELGFWYGIPYSDRWVVDAEKGYAPVMQERIAEDGHVIYRAQMSQWKKVGGAWVAYKVQRDSLSKDPNGVEHISSTATYTVKSCEVNSKKNTPALYKMAWPDGTVVNNVPEGKKCVARNGKLEPAK
jgi:hypothetical protein